MFLKPIKFQLWILLLLFCVSKPSFGAMTMKQLINSMDMMRSVCAPKFNIPQDILEGLRKGVFTEDGELKCYTLCIAQMAGTVTKKGEISLQKTINQLEAMLPPEMKEEAIDAVKQCSNVQKDYKDNCDKTFYSTKCAYEKNPAIFLFP